MTENPKNPAEVDDDGMVGDDATAHVDAEEPAPGESPLLTKVKDLLKRADPGKWRREGEELDLDRKYPQQRDSWEKSYSISINNGILVIRSTQPVKCAYFGGGYTITPLGNPVYTVEIKASSFNARDVVEPGQRTTTSAVSGPAQKVEVLAEGRVAETIYELVHTTVRKHLDDQREGFEHDAQELFDKLLNRDRELTSESWDKTEKEEKEGPVVTYTATISGMKTEVSRRVQGSSERYSVTFNRGGLKQERKEGAQIRELFEIVEDAARNVRLMALSKVLEGVVF